jgi:hypothetical protein
MSARSPSFVISPSLARTHHHHQIPIFPARFGRGEIRSRQGDTLAKHGATGGDPGFAAAVRSDAPRPWAPEGSTMNEQEARSALHAHLDKYRRRSHSELSAMLGNHGCDEIVGPSAVEYQIEVDILWLADTGGDLLVMGSIDDGRGWRAFAPLTESFVVSPNGSVR